MANFQITPDGEYVPWLCLHCGRIGNLDECPGGQYSNAEHPRTFRVPARPHELVAYKLGGEEAVRAVLLADQPI